jgi:hypothetical protein
LSLLLSGAIDSRLWKSEDSNLRHCPRFKSFPFAPLFWKIAYRFHTFPHRQQQQQPSRPFSVPALIQPLSLLHPSRSPPFSNFEQPIIFLITTNMRSISPLSLISVVTALVTLLLVLSPSQTLASPVSSVKRATSSNYWLANIKRQGSVAFGSDSSYAVYRNVMDYGAKGDGSTDDTAAINAAISAGSRCGWGCDSSTVTPALVYFPPGTYMISRPIVMLYYTQLVGDALTLPVLKATAGFQGMAVLDSDPYDSTGANMFTNQVCLILRVRETPID